LTSSADIPGEQIQMALVGVRSRAPAKGTAFAWKPRLFNTDARDGAVRTFSVMARYPEGPLLNFLSPIFLESMLELVSVRPVRGPITPMLPPPSTNLAGGAFLNAHSASFGLTVNLRL